MGESHSVTICKVLSLFLSLFFLIPPVKTTTKIVIQKVTLCDKSLSDLRNKNKFLTITPDFFINFLSE